jgi:hypothetical protein
VVSEQPFLDARAVQAAHRRARRIEGEPIVGHQAMHKLAAVAGQKTGGRRDRERTAPAQARSAASVHGASVSENAAPEPPLELGFLYAPRPADTDRRQLPAPQQPPDRVARDAKHRSHFVWGEETPGHRLLS